MSLNKIQIAKVILLAGSFFLATNIIAAEISKTSSQAVKNDNRKFLYDEEKYGPKAPIIWEKPTKVAFDHAIHTKDAGLSCESCHDDLFTMKTGEILASGKMTMAAMAEGKYCGTCHDGSTAFATNTKCSSCHTEMTEITPKDPIVWTKPVKAVIFDHKAHTEDFSLECKACHDDLFAMQKGAAEKSDNFTMKALYEGKYCGKCHDGSTAFASNTRCNTCHIGVKGDKRIKGAEDSHDKSSKKSKAGH